MTTSPQVNPLANRLKKEKSLYLLQHANNPIDWYPWCDEAFSRAEKEDKPLFISIGYSSCHWCHVMADESFEDTATANLLNKNFICIKVDREERPDVDLFYMQLAQRMTGSGGWPLNVFATPKKAPFFAGTYFPKTSRGPLPSFTTVLGEIVRLWKKERQKIVSYSVKLLGLLEKELKPIPHPVPVLKEKFFELVFKDLSIAFDRENGGFGQAPKFPTTAFINFLIELHKVSTNERALNMATISLEKMRLGGLWDHLEGGFHRYCVDEGWKVPHFEKMLYDQALLIVTYLKAYKVTNQPLFLETALDTARFTIDEFLSENGGFYSSLDADSEGIEGNFYLWSIEELKSVVGQKKWPLFKALSHIEKTGDFPDGRIVLRLKGLPGHILQKQGLSSQQAKSFWEKIRTRLREHRKKRVRPQLDKKIVTSWNALMIYALAELYDATGEKDFFDIARNCLHLLIEKAFLKGELQRCLADGKPRHRACLEDYAALLLAAAKIHSLSNDDFLLEFCKKLGTKTKMDFFDPQLNLFLFASSGANDIPKKLKAPGDGSLPSPISMLFEALSLLSRNDCCGKLTALLPLIEAQGVVDARKNPLANCQFLALYMKSLKKKESSRK